MYKDTIEKGMDLVDDLHDSRAENDAAVTERWRIDSQTEHPVPQLIRPVLAGLFSLAYIIGWLCGVNTEPMEPMLMMILGSYFVSRGVEKVIQRKDDHKVKMEKERAKVQIFQMKQEIKEQKVNNRANRRRQRNEKN